MLRRINEDCQTNNVPFKTEIRELRKHPIYKAHALPVEYPSILTEQPLAKQTDALPIGTQAAFIKGAWSAKNLNLPINTLLTVRWDILFGVDSCNPLRSYSETERISRLVELLRKWLLVRCSKAVYIWVRETSKDGEHWHIAFHLPKGKEKPLTNYVENLLSEPVAPCPRPPEKRTDGEFACSAFGSWQLASDNKPERGGYFLAVYLGKGEPSERLFRGKLIANIRKPVRGRRFGGRIRNSRYDKNQGQVKGSATMFKRFDISRNLKAAIKQA